jgi:hypothetical protein
MILMRDVGAVDASMDCLGPVEVGEGRQGAAAVECLSGLVERVEVGLLANQLVLP